MYARPKEVVTVIQVLRVFLCFRNQDQEANQKKKSLRKTNSRIKQKVVIVEKEINQNRFRVINLMRVRSFYRNQIQEHLDPLPRLIEVASQIRLLDHLYLQMKQTVMSQLKMVAKLLPRPIMFKNYPMLIQSQALKTVFPDSIETNPKVLETVILVEALVMSQLDGKMKISREPK